MVDFRVWWFNRLPIDGIGKRIKAKHQNHIYIYTHIYTYIYTYIYIYILYIYIYISYADARPRCNVMLHSKMNV